MRVRCFVILGGEQGTVIPTVKQRMYHMQVSSVGPRVIARVKDFKINSTLIFFRSLWDKSRIRFLCRRLFDGAGSKIHDEFEVWDIIFKVRLLQSTTVEQQVTTAQKPDFTKKKASKRV